MAAISFTDIRYQVPGDKGLALLSLGGRWISKAELALSSDEDCGDLSFLSQPFAGAQPTTHAEETSSDEDGGDLVGLMARMSTNQSDTDVPQPEFPYVPPPDFRPEISEQAPPEEPDLSWTCGGVAMTEASRPAGIPSFLPHYGLLLFVGKPGSGKSSALCNFYEKYSKSYNAVVVCKHDTASEPFQRAGFRGAAGGGSDQYDQGGAWAVQGRGGSAEPPRTG